MPATMQFKSNTSVPRAGGGRLENMKTDPSTRRFIRSQLTALEAELAHDATWAERNLPSLRGALLLLRHPSAAMRARYTALGEEGPAVIRSSLTLLDEKITHLTQLLRLLAAAKARLRQLEDEMVIKTAFADRHTKRQNVVAVVGSTEAPR